MTLSCFRRFWQSWQGAAEPRRTRARPTRRPRRCRLELEELGARLAPAVLVNATTVAFTDVDGDLVTIKTTKGAFADPAASTNDFTFVNSGVGQQLQLVDLSNDGPEFAGASLSITAVRNAVTGGDGLVNVGRINATGIDLLNVIVDGDLGRIQAGDAVSTNTALAALTVQSLGRFGLSTQAAGGTLDSDVLGRLGALTVKSDVIEANVLVHGIDDADDASGKIGSVVVGGSLFGTGAAGFTTGTIFARGDVGTFSVKGDVAGGRIGSRGKIASITVGGSLIGGATNSSGEILAGTAGSIRITGNIVGSSAISSGHVNISKGPLTSIFVGGSLRGGSGLNSGNISSQNDIGAVTIRGNVVGGTGQDTGQITTNLQPIASGGKIGSVTIGGSLLPGTGLRSGQIRAATSLGPVTITGDVVGGTNFDSGEIRCDSGSIARLTIGGSLLGGGSTLAGAVFANGDIGLVQIGGDVVGGAGQLSGAITSKTGKIAGVTINGSIRTGTGSSSAQIAAQNNLGPVLVKGSLIGTSANPVVIAARGQAVPTTTDVAISSVTVNGRVEFASILGGYGVNASGLPTPLNADAQIGAIRVLGDWVASNAVAGVVDGGNGFGDNNDAKITGGTDSPAIQSRIASISIGGQLMGTLSAGDQFGFVAEQIGAFSVGGTAIPLLAGASNDLIALLLGATGDCRLREV